MKLPKWLSALSAYGLTQLLLAFSAFMKIPLIVGSVGPEGYGVIVLVMSAWTVINAMCEGLSQTSRVMMSEKGEDRDRAISISLGLSRVGIAESAVLVGIGLPMTGLLGAIASPLVGWLGFALLAVATLTLPLATFKGFVEARERVIAVNVALTANVFVGLPAVFLATQGTNSVIVVAIASLVGSASPFIVYAWLERKVLRDRNFWSSCTTKTSSLGANLRPVASMTLWSFATVLAYAFDPFIVGAVLGLEASGAFGLASRVMTMAMVLPLGLNVLVASRVTRWRAVGDVSLLRSRVMRLCGQLAIPGLLLAIATAIIGPPVGRVLGGGEVPTPSNLYAILAAYAFITTASSPIFALFAGPRAARLRGWLALWVGSLNLLLSVVFSLWFGITGPAAASCICLCVMTVVLLVFFRRHPQKVMQTHQVGINS